MNDRGVSIHLVQLASDLIKGFVVFGQNGYVPPEVHSKVKNRVELTPRSGATDPVLAEREKARMALKIRFNCNET